MALTPRATHVLQWGGQRVATLRKGANPETSSQFGLESATRLHEGGIASNRGSACRGEYVPGPCTHRPSHHESCVDPKSRGEPARGAGAEGLSSDWGEVVTR